MADNNYLVEIQEPYGPFLNFQDKQNTYDALGLFCIGYRKNTKHWQVGDNVIHMGDAKRKDMLMKVIGFTRDGLVKTQYVYRFYENEDPSRHWKNTTEIWKNEMCSLLDPADFGIEAS